MKGSQVPRIQIEPKRERSSGKDASMLMEEYSNKLDDWQKTILECWLGRDENGTFTTTSAGLSVPRQNGKNVCLEAREFYGLAIEGEKILHTAHQVKTSKKSFRRLVNIFTDKRHPEIMELVKEIRYTNGEESIELSNGGRIEYSARSRQAARGFDGISLVVFDEAQELTDDQLEALLPTLSASETGTRQMIYAGTPPYPGCPGEVFRRRRENCTTQPAPHDAWHEWSVQGESADEIKTEDVSLRYLTNPALGIRLTEEFTEEELRTMSKDGFCRERLGWWAPTLGKKTEFAIPAELWDSCKSESGKPEGKTAYGVKFSADGAEVCLCGAVIASDGKTRVALIERKPTAHGIKWLADWLNERYTRASCVVIDGRNGVDVLVEKIAETWKQKNSVIRPTARDVIASVSGMMDALSEKALTWYYLQDDLRDSAINATKRPIAGGWGFGGDNSIPIEAAALALWGAKNSKRDPNRTMRIG